MFLLCLIVALCVAFAGDLYDVIMTEKGLKAGVAVEGNTWLVGPKPSAEKLYLRDSLVLALCMVPNILAIHFHNVPFAYGTLAAPVVFGVKHLLGGLSWKKLGVKF